MNRDLDRLHPYPFQRLAHLKDGVTPPASLGHIPLSIGEPKHAAPAFVMDALKRSLDGLSTYPVTRGSDALRAAIADWATRRFRLVPGSLSADRNVLPVNGTREALFAIGQAVVDRASSPLVAMPNPFYQIYEGAALLAGAEPLYLDCDVDHGFVPRFDRVPARAWRQCQLLYLCTPGNPTGAVLDRATLVSLIELAQKHDFIIASDECYSEIYDDEEAPPPGLLEAAASIGHDDYSRCIVFHSLSKRSNLPGLRSGFVAGDADVIERFLLYRTYHGCAMAPPVQAASTVAWRDEVHVRENRRLYRQKFEAVLSILEPVLDVRRPAAGFYLWPRVPGSGEDFARDLFARKHVTVLPGSFLSRRAGASDPGAEHVRMALVASLADCVDAAGRIRDFVKEIS